MLCCNNYWNPERSKNVASANSETGGFTKTCNEATFSWPGSIPDPLDT